MSDQGVAPTNKHKQCQTNAIETAALTMAQ